MVSIQFIGTRHESGRHIVPDHADYVAEFIGTHKPETRFSVTIKKYQKPRSRGRKGEDGNQLGYFFAVVVPSYMNEILFCLKKDEAYYFILNEFSYELVAAKNGKPIKRLIHVDDQMSMEDMATLIDRCLMWASIEHGVFIPSPNRAWRQERAAA